MLSSVLRSDRAVQINVATTVMWRSARLSKKWLFFMGLRCLGYASSNQRVRGSNPFGRTFCQRSVPDTCLCACVVQ